MWPTPTDPGTRAGSDADADAAWSRLVAAASAPYRAVDARSFRFARSKLRRDGVFRHLIEQGLVRPGSTLLDLGCGPGLLASLLAAAGDAARAGPWPGRWPPPPTAVRVLGLDRCGSDVAAARAALGEAGARNAHFVAGDMRDAPFPPSDRVLFIDTLHYLARAEQEQVLRRAREALLPGGALLLRVHDAARPWRFRFGLAVDRATQALRGGGVAALNGRSLADWSATLAQLGLRAEAQRVDGRAPFANLLIVARAEVPPARG